MINRRKGWSYSETQLLIDNCKTMSIQELMSLLKNRSQQSINNKIKNLKAAGKIEGGKTQETIIRAYRQRHKRLL